MESGAKPRKVPEVREGEIAQSRLFLRSFERSGLRSELHPRHLLLPGLLGGGYPDPEGEKWVPSSPGEGWGLYESFPCKCPGGIAKYRTPIGLESQIKDVCLKV